MQKVLYISTNDPAGNAIVAFVRQPDGSLTPLPGSPFPTGGLGSENLSERIGPDDSDQELIISPDKKFLFVVNEGSNNISVFRVKPHGDLQLVHGSPFPSGGKQPVSLALNEENLHVVNRGDGILATQTVPGSPVAGTPGATNCAVLHLTNNGTLSLQPNLTLQSPDGSSPGQVEVSRDKFVFANNFLAPPPPSHSPFAPIFPDSHSEIVSFRIHNHAVQAHAPVALPPNPEFMVNGVFRPFLLGMRAHPSRSILYAGAVTAGQLTVWTWNQQGVLTFAGSVPGVGGLCWAAIDREAHFLYTSNVGPNTIGVFSLDQPMAPVLKQNFVLGGAKGPLVNQPEPYQFTTAPFNLAVDPSGEFLYVVNHTTCVNDYGNNVDPVNCPLGNSIHILKIDKTPATAGTLSEAPFSPMVIPLAAAPNYRNLHPKGLVVADLKESEDD